MRNLLTHGQISDLTEQKPHMRLCMGVRLTIRPKLNNYTESCIINEADGSYYAVADTRWRAYDSWEQSILNHNDYIAARSTDGGKTLRYFPIIGCNNYVLVCQYLQECGYATSITYAESLINDYIEKYHLVSYDEAED